MLAKGGGHYQIQPFPLEARHPRSVWRRVHLWGVGHCFAWQVMSPFWGFRSNTTCIFLQIEIGVYTLYCLNELQSTISKCIPYVYYSVSFWTDCASIKLSHLH